MAQFLGIVLLDFVHNHGFFIPKLHFRNGFYFYLHVNKIWRNF